MAVTVDLLERNPLLKSRSLPFDLVQQVDPSVQPGRSAFGEREHGRGENRRGCVVEVVVVKAEAMGACTVPQRALRSDVDMPRLPARPQPSGVLSGTNAAASLTLGCGRMTAGGIRGLDRPCSAYVTCEGIEGHSLGLGEFPVENPGGSSSRPVSSMWQATSCALLLVETERTSA